MEGGKPVFLSNNAGGILGGISTGQDIIVRFSVKPTSSILTTRRTVDRFGKGSPRSPPMAGMILVSVSAPSRSARR